MPSPLKIGNRIFDFNKQIYLIGILNITPDSFSDGGKFLDPDLALEQALKMQEEGADLIDVGAESTRPGAKAIDIEEEIKRILPVLKKIIPKIKIPLSIDTRKSKVAKIAIEEGVALMNDVSNFQYDSEMLSLLREKNIPAVLMHSLGTPENMSRLNRYESLIETLLSFFEKRLTELEERGISREKLLIDPGIGFAKTGKQNVDILSHLDKFQQFQRPILIGLSRKSFLDEYFGPVSHPQERNKGTEIAHVLALLKGANFLRVHDLKAAKQTLLFTKNFSFL